MEGKPHHFGGKTPPLPTTPGASQGTPVRELGASGAGNSCRAHYGLWQRLAPRLHAALTARVYARLVLLGG